MIIVVKGLIMLAVLIYASISDIKYKEVSNKIYPLLLMAGFLDFSMASIFGFLSVFILTLTFAMLANFGGADVKTAAMCSFIVKGINGLLGLAIGLSLAVIIMPIFFYFSKKKNKNVGTPFARKEFPLIPFLSVGYIFIFTQNLF